MTEMPNPPPSPIVELVRRHGGPMSHAALDPSRSIFRAPGIDGLICFLPTRRCAAVMGDPVCAPEHKAALADAFAAHCAASNRKILYVAATATMQAYARERGYASMEFASLLMADPQYDPEEGPRGRHLRQHLNHTRRTGVTVREYFGDEAPMPGWKPKRRRPVRNGWPTAEGRRYFLAVPVSSGTSSTGAGSLPNTQAALSACSQC